MLALATTDPSLAEARRTDSSCAAVTPLPLGQTWRQVNTENDADCFELDLPSSGLLVLDLAATTEDGSRPVWDIDAGGDGALAVVKRTATTRVLAVGRESRHVVRVVPEDPRRPLASYKLRSAFVADRDLWLKDENNGEVEYEPDLFRTCSQPLATKDEDNGEVEYEPDLSTHCVHDLSLSSAKLAFRLAESCRRGESDDHGDTLLCATSLRAGHTGSGTLENGWGDDQDVFAFRLEVPRTVELTTHGDTDTTGELIDRYAHPLGRDDDGGEAENFRLLRTLGPGLYFVRVAGHGSGDYALSLGFVER